MVAGYMKAKSTHNDAELVALGSHTDRKQELESLDVGGSARKCLELLDGPPVADGAEGVVV